MSTPSPQPQFSRWRAALWPVQRYELTKLLPMLLIFFLIFFGYNVLRILKDTLVINAKSSGPEAIPFIKVWVMFPSAILMTFLFTRLTNRYNRELVFYAMLSIFLVYFVLFATVLYPLRDALHPHDAADAMQMILPAGFKGLIAMFRNWTFTSFYVMSELWSNIILSMLFWGFANQVTNLGEAKRFYSIFGIGGNFSGVAAGMAHIWICNDTFNPSIPLGNDAWEQSMMMLIGLVLVSGVFAMLVFRWFNTKVLTDSRFVNVDHVKEPEKGKLSMRESFGYLFSSRYMFCIALIVIAYNLVINLVEIVWKDQVHELYPTSSGFDNYMGHVQTITGVLATLVALLVSGNAIRKCGWTFTAMLTPAVLLITSIGFFGFFFAKGTMSAIDLVGMAVSPLAIVVFFGTTQNILSRAAKYTVFDATKEMAFVPLSLDHQRKGKPAIDGVCSRLGKSSGSVIHQVLLVSVASISQGAPYVGGILLMVIGGWIAATGALGAQFNVLTGVKKAPPRVPVAEALS